MNKYSNKDIADYYDQTEVHYKSAWDLDESLALHYGYWRENTKNFRESLRHMNEELAALGEITPKDKVMDAGCGVGGSCIFLAKTIGCHATGITLSHKQVESAKNNAAENEVSNLTQFDYNDFTNTNYADNSFDVIWTLEAICHAKDKGAFLREAFRLLRPGGRLVMGEYYKKEGTFTAKEDQILKKWLNAWAIEDISKVSEFTQQAKEAGFSSCDFTNITDKIMNSARRMYYGSFYLGFISSLYRIYNPKVRHFPDNHYKATRYQFPALKKGLWDYYFVKCVKE